MTPRTVGGQTVGDARCGAWAQFMRDVLKAQGIEQDGSAVIVQPTYVEPLLDAYGQREWFLVDSWQFTQTPHAQAAIVGIDGLDNEEVSLLLDRYKYVNVLKDGPGIAESFNDDHTGYEFLYADVSDVAGVQGKGPNSNPASIFSNHALCQFTIGGTTSWFDPSYGVCYDGNDDASRLLDFENDAIAGYCVVAKGQVSEAAINTDLNGINGCNDTVEAWILLIRPEDDGPDVEKW